MYISVEYNHGGKASLMPMPNNPLYVFDSTEPVGILICPNKLIPKFAFSVVTHYTSASFQNSFRV